MHIGHMHLKVLGVFVMMELYDESSNQLNSLSTKTRCFALMYPQSCPRACNLLALRWNSRTVLDHN